MSKTFPSILLALLLPLIARAQTFQQKPTPQEEKQIKQLIENLVFEHPKADQKILIQPYVGSKEDDRYKAQYDKCHQAFQKLRTYQQKAFPLLLQHLEDQRPSIHFKNHIENHTVGDACYWNIRFQLEARPKNYSEYGLQREGKDGKLHIKPYWKSSPFAADGGLTAWLKKHQHLSYTEMQIKCLQWLLENEKQIGASDSDSYYLNIAPLELRILELKQQNGESHTAEITRLQTALKNKSPDQVPANLLPQKNAPKKQP